MSREGALILRILSTQRKALLCKGLRQNTPHIRSQISHEGDNLG